MFLGVGIMLVYGLYLSKNENLLSIGVLVVFVDIGVVVIVGMFIILVMYVVLNNGVEIFIFEGVLI